MSETAMAIPTGAGETEAWRKLTLMALEELARGPVEFSGDERRAFSNRLSDNLAALEDNAETSQILITAGSVAQAIGQYNSQTQRHFDVLVDQFRELMRFLLARSAGLPGGLKQGIEAALATEDLAALQMQLTQNLGVARTAADPPPPRVERLMAFRDLPATAAIDSCTGLPTRPDAEAVIERAISSGAQTYVAAFYVHRMHLINARFGDGIGNQVILFCSQHLATNLSGAKDTLFRWRGPGFVAVLERNESPLTIISEVQRFTSMPLSRFFETPSRTVYLPIKMTAEVFPTAGKNVDEVIDQVQKSLNSHGPED